MNSKLFSRLLLLFGLIIVLLLTFLTLYPVIYNDFVNWDDQGFILSSRFIRPISIDLIKEIFTTPSVIGAYNPMVLLSFAVDYNLGGKFAQVFHQTNLLLHLFNTLLVFLLIYRISKNLLAAIITSLLFGIHPMHLEPVAWISARKELLYVFFLIIAFLLYLNYIKFTKFKWFWFLSSIFFFLLSLLSKNVAVVFPVILMLTDYLLARESWKRLLLEKLPFIIVAIVFIPLAVIAQQKSGAMLELKDYPYHKTVFIGAYNLVIYLIKAIFPYNLSPFHPYTFPSRHDIPGYMYLFMVPILFSLYFLWRNRSRRFIIFGCLFFVLFLLPYIQIIPAGMAIQAERYSYLSYIGPFFIIGTLLSKWVTRNQIYNYLSLSIAALWIFWLGFTTHKNIHIWKDGGTLWTEVIKKYPNHFFAWSNRGDFYFLEGEYEKALIDVNRSIDLNPIHAKSYNNRGRIFNKTGQLELAFNDFSKAIELDENEYGSFILRGILFVQLKNDPKSAISDFESAIKIYPDNPSAFLNLGVLYEMQNQLEKAELNYTEAIKRNSINAEYYKYRAVVFKKKGENEKALKDLNKSIELNPKYIDAYQERSQIYKRMGYDQKSIEDREKVSKYQLQ